MNELALFAGAGGGLLGGKLLGWRPVCAVENNRYAASVLLARQNDGSLPPFPIWDDVCTFDGKPWKGIVNVISGGFPCQDISSAGKGAGIEGKRSGLWKHMARIIGEVEPTFVYIENSPLLRTRGLGVVLQDLAKMGYDAEWGVLGAADVGANHKRSRIWIVAKVAHAKKLFSNGGNDNTRISMEQKSFSKSRNNSWTANVGNSPSRRRASNNKQDHTETENAESSSTECFGRWWKDEPNVGRVADGVAFRVDRLKAIGNGQVPLVAATAWNELNKRFL